MSGIYQIRLTDAYFLVGPKLERLDGFGDDMFSLAPVSDVGAIMNGVLGDTMFMRRKNTAWNATITTLQASRAIDILGLLNATDAAFPVTVTYGNFSLVGFGMMTNMGEIGAGLGATTRTLTMGIAKVSGNTDASPGTILAVT